MHAMQIRGGWESHSQLPALWRDDAYEMKDGHDDAWDCLLPGTVAYLLFFEGGL